MGHRIFAGLPIRCIVGLENVYPAGDCLNQSIKSFTPDYTNEMSFKEFWSGNEFEWFVIFSNIRVKDEVNFFIRELLEIFYFPSSFIVELESF